MVESIFGIIKIERFDNHFDEKARQDIKIFNHYGYKDIYIVVPKVRLLKKVVYGREEFMYKPILFNYGFIQMPINYTYYPESLRFLVKVSKCISGFIYRRKEDLKQEFLRVSNLTEDRLNDEDKTIRPLFKQCLIETVSKTEVRNLNIIASNLDVYACNTELSVGAFVILQGYPFANLSAEIIGRSNNHIQVRLIDSDRIVSVTKENLYYTPYLDEPAGREICFTDLGYIPEISDET